MKRFLLISLLTLSPAQSATAPVERGQGDSSGIITRPSNHPVAQTVDRLKGLLAAKGITLFAVIDHSGEAEKVGLKMRPTRLVVFGNPKLGTPLMTAAPSIAIDLPLKILVWEDEGGKVWLSYNDPKWVAARHHVAPEAAAPLAAVETLAAAAAQ